MITVAKHHGGNISLVPIGKEQAVIIAIVGKIPHVKGFVHNDHTKLVASLKQSQRRRIMSSTNGIKSCFL